MASIDGRIMVVAFEGWNDAGEAASSAVRHVVEACDLEPFDEIEPDDYVDFTFARPLVRRLEDGSRMIAWPSTIAYAPTRPSTREAIAQDAGIEVSTGAEGELFALLGAEPSRNWREFAAVAIDMAKTCEVDVMVFVGAMLADVPHTRPTPTFVTSDSKALRDRLDVGQSEYEGPTGIMSVLALAAEDAGISTVSLWASVPHYVHAAHVPKATIALIDRLSELCDITVPLDDLPEQAGEWESGIDEIADRDDEMRAYIGHLERQRDTVESPEASGEALAKEFQRFLESQRGRAEQSRAREEQPPPETQHGDDDEGDEDPPPPPV